MSISDSDFFKIYRTVKKRTENTWLAKIRVIRKDTNEICLVKYALESNEEEAKEKAECQVSDFNFEERPTDFHSNPRKFIFEVIHTERKISGFYLGQSVSLTFDEHVNKLSNLERIKNESTLKLLEYLKEFTKKDLEDVLADSFSLKICFDEYDVTELRSAIRIIKLYAKSKGSM